ncbi:tellurite resistance/C4-dicarboxylate transporter family protein [Brevibacterium sp. Mu109]|uniref:tellurite resistance/C4-dicarboxylate transporter family protein n=1 Tax=Brevibacterium sp. Mu109 TaxID=1255669 RepID=UPI0021527F1D|nr:tellurite resistance/C4-dicarboxylate transporter family protein [Brevibacterium sp. Mu109]
MTTTTSLPVQRLDRALAGLSPGYFALVMATGIVAVGLDTVGIEWASAILLVIAVVAYAVLAALYALRWFRHRERVKADQRDPEKTFGYFTIVAGTGVLSVGLLETRFAPVSIGLVVVAAAVWLVLGYILPWQVLMARDGEPILARTNGTWFIWSVGSQSVAVALAAVLPLVPQHSHLIGTLTVMSWSVGTLLYAGIAVLVTLRFVHHGVTPEQFEPPYWVAMGALAISVVAGAGIADMPSTPMIDASRSLVSATVVIFWCFAAWLIPMFAGAGIWRHVVHRVPLRYTPALWSMVFPLGMFAVASLQLGRVDRIPALEAVGTVFLGVAVCAWLAVAVGFVVSSVRRVRG